MERSKVPHASRSQSCFYLKALHRHDQIRGKAQTQAVRQVRCQDPFFHVPYGNLCFGLFWSLSRQTRSLGEDILVETLIQ